MGLGKHLLRGSGANVLDLVIKTVAMFVTTPLMVRCLGQNGYGSWLLVMSVIGYFLMVDLGATFSATRFLSIAIGSGDERRQGVLLAVSKSFFRLAGASILIATFCALPLIPWLVEDSHTVAQMMVVLVIIGATTALRFSLRSPMIILRAHVRYDLLAWTSISRSLFQAPVMCWVLLHGGGLLGVALVHGTGDCLELGLQIIAARRMQWPSAGDLKGDEAKSIRHELYAYSRSIVLGMIGYSLRLQVNPLLISKMFGVSEVPVYSIGVRLITMLEDVVNALFGGQILSAFGQLHGAEKHEALREQFRRVTKLTSSFSAWAVGGIAFFGEAFFRRWMGDGFGRAHEVMLILAVPYALQFMQYPAHSLLFTLNKQQWHVWMNFIGGIVSVIFALILGPLLGLHGIVLGIALETGIVYLFIMPWLVRKSAQMHPVDYLVGSVLWPGFRSLVLPAAYACWARRWLTPDYTQLLLCGAGYTLVFVVTAPWLVLDAEMRSSLWRTLRRRAL
jgi:O-antigen/teichoic acid export membrane protein